MSWGELVRRWTRKRLTVEELRELAKDHGYMIRPWPGKTGTRKGKEDKMSVTGIPITESDAAVSELHDLPEVDADARIFVDQHAEVTGGCGFKRLDGEEKG